MFSQNDNFQNNESMSKGFIFSIIFHIAILLLMIIGLPFSLDKEIIMPELVGFEMVTSLPENPEIKQVVPEPKPEPIIEKPTPQPLVPPEPEFVPEETKIGAIEDQPTPPPPAPIPEPDPIPAPKPEVKPDIKPEIKPDIVQKPAPVKDIKPEPKPMLKPVPQAAAIKPMQKPKNPNAPKTKEDKEFDDVLESVLAMDEAPKVAPKKPTESGGKQGPKGLDDSDIAMIAKQIEPCWEFQEVRDVNIVFKVDISKDGHFTNPKMDETYEITSNPVNRAIADAAHRAILNPKCNDFGWLKKKYADVSSLKVNFNPRNMVGY
ncbi:MAG: hypothetical protein Q8L85_08560 [Alphaproteobacteria bacterium]|nr:hypothetical protein [Alphaproteobacteria bacterium]